MTDKYYSTSNINEDDIESDVLTESEDDETPNLSSNAIVKSPTKLQSLINASLTPLKSPRGSGALDSFSPLSGWDGQPSEFSNFGFYDDRNSNNHNDKQDNRNVDVDEDDGNDEDYSDRMDEDVDNTDDYQSFDEEEENYKTFIASVRLNPADENSVAMMDASFLYDEDLDEEDYQPDDAMDDGSDSDEDNDDNIDDIDDLLHGDMNNEVHNTGDDNQAGSDSPYYGLPVRKKELAALLGDCWLTITGDNPEVGATAASNANNRSSQTGNANSNANSNPVLQSHSLLSSLMSQFFSGNKISEPLIDGFPIAVYRKILARQMSMAIQILLHILIQSEDRSHAFATSYQYLLQLHNHRINAVKKAALLQMNMETFLAVKQNQSNTHTSAGQHQQDARIIKQNQIQALMEEVAPHLVHRSQPQRVDIPLTISDPLLSSKGILNSTTNIHNQNQSHHAGFHNGVPNNGNNFHHNNSNDITNGSNSAPYQHRVLTRSSMINYNAQSRRSSSVLDVPILSNFNELLKCIDQAQKRYKAQVLQFAIRNNMATVFNNQFLLSDFAPQDRTYRQFLLQSSALQLEEVYHSVPKSKFWKSLIPTSYYPFPESFWLSLDATSIVGKTFFTPAEEDLLIRGVLRYGDQAVPPSQNVDMHGIVHILPGHDPWSLIQRDFLPTRNASLLQFHYQQKTAAAAMPSILDTMLSSNSGSASLLQKQLQLGLQQPGGGMFDFLQTQNTGNNIFKRFQWIRSRGWLVDKRDPYWHHPEDMNLLRGFQVFGHRWQLLAKIFLPHRRVKDVRIRWRTFLRLWGKTFPNFEQRAREVIFEDQALTSSTQFDLHRAILESLLSPKLQSFLQDIQECGSYSSLALFAEKGLGRHMAALEKQLQSVSLTPVATDTSATAASLPVNSVPATTVNNMTLRNGLYTTSVTLPPFSVVSNYYSNASRSSRAPSHLVKDGQPSVVAALFAPSAAFSSSLNPVKTNNHSIRLNNSKHTDGYSNGLIGEEPEEEILRNADDLQPAPHYAALNRVHDVFDFEHTQWGDISCDELSDGNNENSNNKKVGNSSSNGKNGNLPGQKFVVAETLPHLRLVGSNVLTAQNNPPSTNSNSKHRAGRGTQKKHNHQYWSGNNSNSDRDEDLLDDSSDDGGNDHHTMYPPSSHQYHQRPLLAGGTQQRTFPPYQQLIPVSNNNQTHQSTATATSNHINTNGMQQYQGNQTYPAYSTLPSQSVQLLNSTNANRNNLHTGSNYTTYNNFPYNYRQVYPPQQPAPSSTLSRNQAQSIYSNHNYASSANSYGHNNGTVSQHYGNNNTKLSSSMTGSAMNDKGNAHSSHGNHRNTTEPPLLAAGVKRPHSQVLQQPSQSATQMQVQQSNNTYNKINSQTHEYTRATNYRSDDVSGILKKPRTANQSDTSLHQSSTTVSSRDNGHDNAIAASAVAHDDDDDNNQSQVGYSTQQDTLGEGVSMLGRLSSTDTNSHLNSNNNNMGLEELLGGFSNFTRDISMMRAEILVQEQEEQFLLQQGEREKKGNQDASTSHMSKEPTSNSSDGKKSGTGNLFASVMRGAK